MNARHLLEFLPRRKVLLSKVVLLLANWVLKSQLFSLLVQDVFFSLLRFRLREIEPLLGCNLIETLQR
jgi:hypothetical protein